jgi:hypothetical protein
MQAHRSGSSTAGDSRARGRHQARIHQARIRTGAAVALLAALALLAAGCGGGSSGTTTTTTTAAPAPAATTTTTTTTGASSESGLSGQWKGQYSGTYNGTFILHWQQSGSSLSGKITISAPLATLAVNGTLHGSSITFGTVGSLAITYTGTVSGGSSMSGSYHTPNGGGSWSATKY